MIVGAAALELDINWFKEYFFGDFGDLLELLKLTLDLFWLDELKILDFCLNKAGDAFVFNYTRKGDSEDTSPLHWIKNVVIIPELIFDEACIILCFINESQIDFQIREIIGP